MFFCCCLGKMSHWLHPRIQKKAERACSPRDEIEGFVVCQSCVHQPRIARERGTDTRGTKSPALPCQRGQSQNTSTEGHEELQPDPSITPQPSSERLCCQGPLCPTPLVAQLQLEAPLALLKVFMTFPRLKYGPLPRTGRRRRVPANLLIYKSIWQGTINSFALLGAQGGGQQGPPSSTALPCPAQQPLCQHRVQLISLPDHSRHRYTTPNAIYREKSHPSLALCPGQAKLRPALPAGAAVPWERPCRAQGFAWEGTGDTPGTLPSLLAVPEEGLKPPRQNRPSLPPAGSAFGGAKAPGTWRG